MSNNVKALITGGAGFIGSHLADELVNRGCHVIILDDLSTGRTDNIQHLLTGNRIEFIQGNVTDFPLLKKIFFGVDYIFHEAAIASVPRSIENPIETHEVNVSGTLNVLTAARDNKVKKVIFASSSAVYGDTPDINKKEDIMLKPMSPYAVSKLAGEYYCDVFSTIYRLSTVCLRYFNVYGYRQDSRSGYAAVIPKFIERLKTDQSLIIYGNGEQTRDFIYVRDIVSANLFFAENKFSGTYNIGCGIPISLNKLTKMLLKITGHENTRIINEAERTGDIKHSLADISRAKNAGFVCTYDLEMGLNEMLDREQNILPIK